MNESDIVGKIEKQAKKLNYCKEPKYENAFLLGYMKSCLASAIHIMPAKTRKEFLSLQGVETEQTERPHISSDTPKSDPEQYEKIMQERK